MALHTVLLVDDDTEIAALIASLLAKNAISTCHVETIASARESLAYEKYDALILDIMLADGSGLDFCRELQSTLSKIPVLMLSARGDTFDRVLGLEIGADDYVAKPFEPMEFVARVRALLRRANRDETRSARRSFGHMQIELLARQVTLNSQKLDLTTAEYKLLLTLTDAPAVAMSRDALSRSIQPSGYMPSDRSVDVQIARLRKKLHDVDATHDWITTVRGEGYVFTLPPQT
jgi:DNA-binding response OmpR family regulator